MEQFVSAPLPRDEKLALVDDWDCLRVSLCSLAYSPSQACSGACQELHSLLDCRTPDLKLDFCMLQYIVQRAKLYARHASLCCRSPHLIAARQHPCVCAMGWALILLHAGHGGGVGGQLRHPGPVRHAALAHLRQPVQCRRACRHLCKHCGSAVHTSCASVLSTTQQQRRRMALAQCTSCR